MRPWRHFFLLSFGERVESLTKALRFGLFAHSSWIASSVSRPEGRELLHRRREQRLLHFVIVHGRRRVNRICRFRRKQACARFLVLDDDSRLARLEGAEGRAEGVVLDVFEPRIQVQLEENLHRSSSSSCTSGAAFASLMADDPTLLKR